MTSVDPTGLLQRNETKGGQTRGVRVGSGTCKPYPGVTNRYGTGSWSLDVTGMEGLSSSWGYSGHGLSTGRPRSGLVVSGEDSVRV